VKKPSRVFSNTLTMKDFKIYVARKDEIDFSLVEKNGHVVYVPAKGKSGQVPGILKAKFMSR